jgi:hypothetical protein
MVMWMTWTSVNRWIGDVQSGVSVSKK